MTETERQAALVARLQALIRGDVKPHDAAEALAFAYLAYQNQQFGPSARLFAGAFQSDPKLAEDMTAHNRYNAACAAARAAAGKGDDKPPLSEPEQAQWRKQALDWLKADLAHWTRQARSGPPQAKATVKPTLDHWKGDTDLAAIRDEDSLNRLPEEERKAGRSLWAEVNALLLTVQPDPKSAASHHNLGIALFNQDKMDEAITEFRETMHLDGDHVGDASFNLGLTLRRVGRYEEALELFRGLPQRIRDEPGSSEERRAILNRRVQNELAETGRLAALAARLPAMIRGDEKPRDAAEGLAFAYLAYHNRQFGPSARLFVGAFRADPKLAEDMTAWNRYNAACAAARAATGKGDDKPPLSEPEQARWRKQALDWLKADLAHWTKLARSDLPEAKATAKQVLDHWKVDTNLAAIRDEDSLKNLPEEEREACRSLWAEVNALLKTAGPR